MKFIAYHKNNELYKNKYCFDKSIDITLKQGSQFMFHYIHVDYNYVTESIQSCMMQSEVIYTIYY